MPEKHDTKKLQAFMEAALTNPLHPVYRLGYARSTMFQHYATNVMVLESILPEQWFKEYPQYTERIEEVIKLLQTIEPEPVADQAGHTMAESKPAQEVAPVVEAEKVETVTEADKMNVKCPDCGKEFSVPMKGA